MQGRQQRQSLLAGFLIDSADRGVADASSKVKENGSVR